MYRYFKIVNARPGVFILQDNTRLDLRLGFPSRCFEVWKTGRFRYLALKPEAVEMLSKLTITELADIVNKSVNIEDLEIIKKAKRSVKFKKLVQTRIDVLMN